MYRIDTIPTNTKADNAWTLATTLTDEQADFLMDMLCAAGEVSMQCAVDALRVHSDAIYAEFCVLHVDGIAYVVIG